MGEVWFLGLGAKLGARRAEARGPKGRERGWSSWGGGSEPPPHQLEGLGECCKLPQRDPGQSPGRKRILDVEDPIKRIWWWQISRERTVQPKLDRSDSVFQQSETGDSVPIQYWPSGRGGRGSGYM